jgi:putative ABC transport system permease protein
LGVAIAFATLLTPFVYYDLFERMFTKQYTEVQVMDYDVNLVRPVTQSELALLTGKVAGYAEGYFEVPVVVLDKEGAPPLSIIGIEQDTQIYNLKNAKGKPIKLSAGDFYISEGFAMSSQISKGDKISLQLYNTDQTVALVVTEIVDQKLGSNGYMTKQTLYDTFTFSAIYPINETELYSGFYVQGEINQAELEKTALIATIFSAEAIIQAYQQYTSLIYASLFILLLFGGLIAFIIIYQVSLMNINERKIEFASLRLLGVRNKELYTIVFNENLLASIIGIIVGVPIGIAMIDYLAAAFSNDLYSLSVNYTLRTYLFAIISTLVFITIGQLTTWTKIKRLDLLSAVKTRIS